MERLRYFLKGNGWVALIKVIASIQSIFICLSGAMAAQTAHKWAEVFISNDLDEFDCENRGGKYTADFYDFFPEIEDTAKEYTLERCSEKSASFAIMDLAKFIDEKFYEATNQIKG